MKKQILFLFLFSLSIGDADALPQRNIHTPIAYTGDFLEAAIPLSALLWNMWIQDYEGARQLGWAWTSTILTTRGLKYAVGRPRPWQDPDERGTSFPSGHTASAFAGAAHWQMRHGWAVGAPMYAAAAFVGYSRIHANMHRWDEVFVGAGLGIGFNMLFTSRHMPAHTRAHVSPTMNGGAVLNFRTTF